MKYFFLSIVIIVSSYSCNKRIFDYRNDYVGEYQFSGCNYIWNAISGYSDTTFFEEKGTISYDRKDDRDKLTISINNLMDVDMTLNKNGIINICLSEGSLDKDKNLNITFNKLYCEQSPIHLGGKEMYVLSGKSLH